MNEVPHFLRMSTPLGELCLTARDGALASAHFFDQRRPPVDLARLAEVRSDPLLDRARAAFEAYFVGASQRFVVPFVLHGTPFQRRVWEALATLDYGRTATYGDIAARIGAPSAVRAVGAAIGRNPLAILIPCHRVVGATGALTGYAGGLHRKRALLDLEQGTLLNSIARAA